MKHCWKQWKIVIAAVVTTALPAFRAEPFCQGQLNELVRDLNLSIESSELLASRLGEHGVLDSGTKYTFYRNRDDLLLRFFTTEDDFVFCNNIPGFLTETGLSKYNSDEWRLFIDGSKQVCMRSDWTLSGCQRTLSECEYGFEQIGLQ